MVDRKFLNADLGWRNFDLVDKHDTVDHHTPLVSREGILPIYSYTRIMHSDGSKLF